MTTISPAEGRADSAAVSPAPPTVPGQGAAPTGAGAAPPTPAQKFLRGFSALQTRNYRLFWIGQLISLTGTWVQTTAQGWLVLQLTDSPLALGLVTTLQFLPSMLLSLFGGAIADRFAKFRLIKLTQSAALVQAAIFGVLVGTGAIQLWMVYALALMLGLISALDTPVRQAFVIELVRREDVPNAVALNSLLFNTARIFGPAVAGILIARLGLAPAFYINAVSFVGVLTGLFMMDPRAFRAVPPRSYGSVLEGVAEGVRYAWRTPAVLLVLTVMAFIGTFGYNFNVVLPLISGYVLRTDAVGFGMLSTAMGVGSLAGALAVAYAGAVTPRRLLTGAAAFSVLLGAVALSRALPLTLGLLVLLGGAGIIFTTSANTLVQLTVPDALRGRVVSLYWLLFAGTTPIGAFLIGTLAEQIGVAETLALCAALCLVGVGIGWGYWRRTGEK
jgi:MFS family permease